MPLLPTLRQLEYFIAAADLGSFRRAAEACHVSQPGLSDQIRRLEEQLDVKLLERGRGPVLLTQAGAAILERARAMLTDAQDLVHKARMLSDPLTGPIRLGVIPTIAPYLLPRVLPPIRSRYPRLQILLREGQTADLLGRLAQGSLDLLLLALEAPLGDVETLPLFSDRFWVALHFEHPVAKHKRVTQANLEGLDVLLLEDGHCLGEQTRAICRNAGAREAIDFQGSSLPTLIQMVNSAVGITLVPEMAVALETQRATELVLRPLVPEVGRTIGLAWRRSSPWGEAFAKLGEALRP